MYDRLGNKILARDVLQEWGTGDLFWVASVDTWGVRAGSLYEEYPYIATVDASKFVVRNFRDHCRIKTAS